MNYYAQCWKKYAVFNGRARRREYWSFCIINAVILLLLVFGFYYNYVWSEKSIRFMHLARELNYDAESAIWSRAHLEYEEKVGLFAYTSIGFFLLLFLPSLSAMVRRLHDVGRSGWFMLIQLIPVVGSIVIFITMLLDSKPGANRYGLNPKEAVA